MQVSSKIRIDKPVGEVFEALVDPAHMAHYWFVGVERWEPGRTLTLRYPEYGAQVNVQVLEVQPGRKLVFQWAGSPHVVTITLDAVAAGSTVVGVTQTGWTGNEEGLIDQLVDNKEGWVYMLTCLKAYLDFGVTQLRAALVK